MQEPSKSSRLLALDAMRFLAACGVVWIHTVSVESIKFTSALGRFAVPFFVIASLWLTGQSLRRKPEMTWGRFSWDRLRLLYGAFLMWDAIYILARMGKHAVFHQGMPIEWHWSLLWGGASLQLWFLPFLLIVSVLSFPVLKTAATRSNVAAWAAIIAIFAAAGACFLQVGDGWDVGNAQFLRCSRDALPAAFIGIAAACAFQWIADFVKSPTATTLGFAAWIGATAAIMMQGRGVVVETLAGIGAMLVAWSHNRSTVVQWLARGGVYAFGIYLVHPLFTESMQAAANRVHLPDVAWMDLLIALLAIAMSLVSSYVLRRTPLVVR